MSLIHPTFASTPPVTQEKGGVLVQRTTLDPKKTVSAQSKGGKGGNHTAKQLPALRGVHPCGPPGRFAPILPPSGSRLAALPPSPAVQSRRWRHCVTGKGADPDQQPLPLHCSLTTEATFKELTMCSYITVPRVERRSLRSGTDVIMLYAHSGDTYVIASFT